MPARPTANRILHAAILTAACLSTTLLSLSACSSPGGVWGSMAVSTAPAKPPIPASDAESAAAKKLFLDTLLDGKWEAIPAAQFRLTAAYLDHPSDPELALYLAHSHLWRISERARIESPDPTITNHLILAQHYFEQAAALSPHDRRILGWLGAVEMAVGTIDNEQRLIRRGYFRTKDSVNAYAEFNGFTFGFSMSNASDDQLAEAVSAMWKSAARCSNSRVVPATPSADSYDAIARTADPACFNTPKAPHNWEGFWWTLGVMELKSGHIPLAKNALQNARLSPTYATWSFRDRLERDLAEADSLAGSFSRREPAADGRLLINSPFACVACHQR